MKMTSAYASKLIKQLEEEKAYWTEKENDSCTYVAAADETPIIPDYDFGEVSGKIAEIDNKIIAIKHAVNLANAESKIIVGDKVLSVDRILVRMAQLNKRKNSLDYMRKRR